MTRTRTLRNCSFTAALLGCIAAPGSAEALRITELMAANSSTVADEDGDFSDWIEIFNEGASSADLDGLYLSDDESLPTKWRLPAVALGAGQYLLVWASDKNRAVPGQPLHTNFKLSASGEYLGLVASDGATVLDEYVPSFPPMSDDRSYGLASDLATQRCFILPTPGAANDESADCVATAPVTLSPEHGFYDAPFEATISTATPGAVIHYTLDGSDPSPIHGLTYSGPIAVNSTTMLRAMAFGEGLQPTPSVTATYIFLEAVLQQKQSDQPPEYLFQVADYDMDPDVVNDPRYASEIRDDLKAIPTLSIVTDVDHLFGPQNGIYTHRLGSGVAWERPTSVEMIRSDGKPGFQINCGIRMQGGVSRISDIGKYSFRLLFKSSYGPSKLNYPFFPDSPVDSFDTITLTATHGNSWAGGDSRAEYIRDSWIKDTQLAMGQVASHSTYVQLYLNGRYWGMYRPTERPSAPFLASYFGGVEEDYDALNAGKVIDGARDAWNTLQQLAAGPVDTLAGWNAVRQYLDAENFADYMMVNIYAGNTDWPDKNWYAGRRREAGAGFRFFSWDGEQTFASVTGNRVNVGAPDSPGSIWQWLRHGSPEFRLLFADRVHKHFFHGGALTPERAAERWRKRRDEIHDAIVGESARWGDRRRDVPYTRDVEWIVENQRLLLSLFPARTEVQLAQFRAEGLYPRIEAPEFSQHGGSFFPGFAVGISATQGQVWYTTDGSDPRSPGGAVSPEALLYTEPVVLTAGLTLKARALSGGSWSALEEADFAPASPLRISELMYNPAAGAGAEYIEIHNIGASPASLSGVQLTAGVSFAFPPVLLAAGARALVVEHAGTFQSVYGSGHPVLGVYSGRLDNGGERVALHAGDGSAIQDFEHDDAWYPQTDGPGRSLVIRDDEGDLSLWSEAAGWRASAMNGGTPGDAEAPYCSNGIDDDGDGSVDLADAGCADASADDEEPECDDGVDNDGDGAVDLADLQCSTASRASESPNAGDSFLCYTTRASSGQPFSPVTITLEDELDGVASYTAARAASICVPGERDGVAVLDGETALRAYEIKSIAGEPAHQPLQALRYESGLGPIYVDTVKPARVLLPAALTRSGPVAEPPFAGHGVDYYKCYRAAVSKKTPRYFPPQAQIRFDDRFESRDYLLRPPSRVCTPASLDGAPVKNPGRHLLCYKALRGRYSSAHVPVTGLLGADALGQTAFSTSREEEVCVPAALSAD